MGWLSQRYSYIELLNAAPPCSFYSAAAAAAAAGNAGHR
jgi:hypothetical protein